jgi:hypothetical protein
MTSSAELRGANRWLISCRKRDLKNPQVDTDELIKRVVSHWSGDFQKASLIGTYKGRRTFILFDYDNPKHLSDCVVVGYRIKGSVIARISDPTETVHAKVERWKEENKKWNCSFSHHEMVC